MTPETPLPECSICRVLHPEAGIQPYASPSPEHDKLQNLHWQAHIDKGECDNYTRPFRQC